jgi:D-aminopeptidase
MRLMNPPPRAMDAGLACGDLPAGRLNGTTGNVLLHDEKAPRVNHRFLNEDHIDSLFEAMADATQEGVLDAPVAAGSMTGRSGRHRPALVDPLTSLSTEA